MSKSQTDAERTKEEIPLLKARIKYLEQRLEERTAELTQSNKIQTAL